MKIGPILFRCILLFFPGLLAPRFHSGQLKKARGKTPRAFGKVKPRDHALALGPSKARPGEELPGVCKTILYIRWKDCQTFCAIWYTPWYTPWSGPSASRSYQDNKKINIQIEVNLDRLGTIARAFFLKFFEIYLLTFVSSMRAWLRAWK